MIAGNVLAALVIANTSIAQQVPKDKTQASQGTMHHIVLKPADLKWTAAPSSLPPGAQVAIMDGDPSKKGMFTMRIKMPANYKIPAHWHPADEHVTVIEGSFMIGAGDAFDESKMEELPVGSFVMLPAKMNHFAMAKEETIVQLHGMGPWAITYVNPKDNPANAGTK